MRYLQHSTHIFKQTLDTFCGRLLALFSQRGYIKIFKFVIIFCIASFALYNGYWFSWFKWFNVDLVYFDLKRNYNLLIKILSINKAIFTRQYCSRKSKGLTLCFPFVVNRESILFVFFFRVNKFSVKHTSCCIIFFLFSFYLFFYQNTQSAHNETEKGQILLQDDIDKFV